MDKNRLKIFKTIFKNRWSVFFGLNFLVLAVFLSILIFSFQFYYKNKIYPGVEINNIDLSEIS